MAVDIGTWITATLAGVAAAVVGAAMPAHAADAPRLHTNESYVREVLAEGGLDIDDPRAVLRYVLRSMPDRVVVYPTENYYYFWFIHRGARYAGNLNLDASDRDLGRLHFAYYLDAGGAEGEDAFHHLALDAASGVLVQRLSSLTYRVTHEGRVVTFDLNDLTGVGPPAAALSPDERYLGPIHDESGVRFFLVLNTRLRTFLYVLDESAGVGDRLMPLAGSKRVSIGSRTGFAFFQDHRLDRKLLVGVATSGAESNSYFDGPFDQLPDNFIRGDELRDAIILVDPSVRGLIDRYGNFEGGEDRFMIAPYLEYRDAQALSVFDRCVDRPTLAADQYYNCFVVDSGAQAPRALPSNPAQANEPPVSEAAGPPSP